MHNDPHIILIIGSSVVILAYLINLLAKKIHVPGVLILMGLGIVLQVAIKIFQIEPLDWYPILEILGIVGIILIVLEAALELKLQKGEYGLIWRSIALSLILLISNSLIIAWIFQLFMKHLDFVIALVYALPISIVSSAIVISSIMHLDTKARDFMILESTFSDIFGIMAFYFLIGNINKTNGAEIGLTITGDLIITIVISMALSYIMVYALQNLQTGLRLFLLIAILLILYSLGKLMHKSSLLFILIFGLMLSNPHFFFRGKLEQFININKIRRLRRDFRMFTLESAFVVRSYFFFIFGAAIDLQRLFSFKVASVSLICLLVIMLTRFILYKPISKSANLPGAYIAPRGLVSILLFFSIPEELIVPDFEAGILLFVILITNVILAITLIAYNKRVGLKSHGEEMDLLYRAEVTELDTQKRNGTDG